MLFYRTNDRKYIAQVDLFFRDMHTPIDPAVEHGTDYASDSRQYLMMGNQCLVYGGFICVLLLIPNPASARIAILCCGALMTGTGTLLRVTGGRLRLREAAASPRPTGSGLGTLP